MLFFVSETFNHFSSLQELEAPLCALKGIRINLNDFEYLQILDLSYNNLTPEDVGALSILPKLRALYLTGNALTHLPLNLCSNVLFKSLAFALAIECYNQSFDIAFFANC